MAREDISAGHSLRLVKTPVKKLWAIFHIGDDFRHEPVYFIAADVLPGTRRARMWYFFVGEGGIRNECDPPNLVWVGDESERPWPLNIEHCPCRSCLESKERRSQ